jgi:hypothetical protein
MLAASAGGGGARMSGSQDANIHLPAQTGWRRSVQVATKSTCRLPHLEQTSRSRQSGTGVSAPYRAAISAGSGST